MPTTVPVRQSFKLFKKHSAFSHNSVVRCISYCVRTTTMAQYNIHYGISS